jgi:hypothetical protein
MPETAENAEGEKPSAKAPDDATSPAPKSGKKEKGLRLPSPRTLAIILIFVVVIALVLMFLPIHQTYSIQVSSHGINTYWKSKWIPSGTSVSFSWSTGAGNVTFVLNNPAGTTIYDTTASSGSYSFSTSGAGTYQFGCMSMQNQTTTINLSYSAPLLSYGL